MSTVHFHPVEPYDIGSSSRLYTGWPLAVTRVGNDLYTPEWLCDGGFRFQDFTIPQGATIITATLTLWLAGEGYEGGTRIKSKFYAAAEDDAAAFNGSDRRVHLVPRSTAYVQYNPPPWGWGTPDYPLPIDLAPVVQEIINRAGWTSGNALSLLWVMDDDSTPRELLLWTRTVDTDLELTYSTADPTAPTLDVPYGGEGWKEGETRTLEWTQASPEHPDGAPVTYHLQFSADGTFDDAVEIASGVTGGSYEWTLPLDLVTADTNTCKIRIRAECAGSECYSAWVTSPAFQVAENNYPVASLVSPADKGMVQGLFPTFVFGTYDADGDDVHVQFQLSCFSDYRDPVIDTDSVSDYADWLEAEPPSFDTWTTLGAGGAVQGNELKYRSLVQLRYDRYYGRVRLFDGILTGEWVEFSCTLVQDSSTALQVSVGGRSYDVSACVIAEETGGEASSVTLTINLSQWRASPCAKGETIAIASALGDHDRTWNATLERWTFASDGASVVLFGLQDDAYLSRKVATGDLASADLGANLADLVDTYGSPLQNDHIDTATGVSMAVTGAYKYLREHLDDAVQALPSYLYWVDTAGEVWFVDQADLPAATVEIYEEAPS